MHVLQAVAPVSEKPSAGADSITEADELAGLLAEAHERGYIAAQALASALEDLEVTREQVHELYSLLEEQGVEIVVEPRTEEPELAAGTEDLADGTGEPAVELDLKPAVRRNPVGAHVRVRAALQRKDVIQEAAYPCDYLSATLGVVAAGGWA